MKRPSPALARLLRRVLRYGLVGLAVSLLYTAGVMLAVAVMPARSATLASAVAFVLVLPIAYLGHCRIAFFDAAGDAFQPWRFAVTTTSTFFVAVGGMYLATDILGYSYLLGIAFNWAMIPAANFLIYVFWVFRIDRREVADILAAAGKWLNDRSAAHRGSERS